MFKKILFFAIFAFLTFASAELLAQGVLRGKIIDKQEGLSLAGAKVIIANTSFGSITNKNGEFTILNVPAGNYEIKVNYIGYEPFLQTIEILDGKTAYSMIELNVAPIVQGSVVVIGEQLKGQAKALNQQKNNINITNVVSSDQVGRFPDENIGDALKRITGVTVQYDQGEARFGLIRGTSPYLNSITINGDRVPSAEGDNRTIQLDLVPAAMVQSIEVNKAITADMDADAIGGSINLVTKNVPNRDRVSVTAASGYNLLSSKPILNGSLTAGARLLDDKLGMSVSGFYNNHHLGSDNIEANWLQGPNGTAYLGNFEVREYDIIRVRQSLSAGLDYKFNNDHAIYFGAIYNHRNDWENRYRLRLRYDKGDAVTVDGVKYKGLPDANGDVKNVEIIRQNKQGIDNDKSKSARLEDQKTFNLSLSGDHIFANILKVNWHGNWAKASEEKPNERYISYRDKKGVVSPSISNEKEPLFNVKEGTDLSKFSLNELTESYSYTDDIDMNGRLDFEMPLMSGENKNKVKFGARYRGKEKKRDNNFFSFKPVGNELDKMNQTTLIDVTNDNFLAGPYKAGSFVNKDFAGKLDLYNSALFEKTDVKDEYIGDNFTAKEKIFGGYLLIEQNIGENLVLNAGLRMENTSVDYKAFELEYDEDNEDEPYKITPTTGEQKYTNILPSLHVKYSVASNLIIRAAFTNTLARPSYYDLAPYRSIIVADNELSEGNSKLKPTTSMNFDLIADFYCESIGILSGGVFYKSINDYFYTKVVKDYLDPKSNKTFDYYYHPENGAKAKLFGIELAIQRQLDFLPGFLKGFGIYLNYTYTSSEAEGLNIPGREQEKISLPGTANNMFNASLSYEWDAFTMRVSLNHTGSYVDEFGEEEFFDSYYDKQTFLDINASYEIIRGLTFFTEFNNITNQPLRYYQGKGQTQRTMQAEFYDMRINAGLKYDL